MAQNILLAISIVLLILNMFPLVILHPFFQGKLGKCESIINHYILILPLINIIAGVFMLHIVVNYIP